MNQPEDRQVHQILHKSAAGFVYPPTPDVRAAVHERLRRPKRRPVLRLQPVGALLTLLLAVALLMLVPQVRAAMIDVLRAGGITIFVDEPTPEARAPGALAATATATGDGSEPVLLVPATPTSPEAAQEALGQAGVPSDSTEIGPPDQYYVDDEREAQVVISVWIEEGKPQYTLYTIATAQYAFKGADTVISTNVDGAQAFWVDGLHDFSLQDRSMWKGPQRSGSVLIWWQNQVTYRLEGAETLEEAQRIATSLR